jgi:hypothetical protein
MNGCDRFSLVLFSTEPELIRKAVGAGIDTIIVDWEYIGKEERQSSADTEINHDTLADLQRVRACTDARVLCRINSYGETTSEEIEQAIEAGADEIFLPMVRSVEEVQAVLIQVHGRCSVGVLIETLDAVRIAERLTRLPLSRVYVGLNDLAIERKTPNIFTALADGTVESLRRLFQLPFGWGGLTVPDLGLPIPCRLLIGEMARLKCSFSFLRRSFHRDIRNRDLAVEVPHILDAIASAHFRSPERVAQEKRDLAEAISAWSDGKLPL